MLAWIGFIVIVLWLLGMLGDVAGGFVNLLLLVGIILLIAHFLRGHSHSKY